MSSLSPAPCPRGMPRNLAVCIAILLLTAACATTPKAPPPSGQDVFILLPDEQGKTGSIIVSGAGGERLLSEPRQAVTVAPGAAPGEPFVMARAGGRARRYNFRPPLKRARAVAALLAEGGVAPSILSITSHGEDNPLVPTGNEVPEPRNRRVGVPGRQGG